jgi:hypothetical protein
VKGYKAFNSDLSCRGFQYEVGKTYTTKGELEICKNGFHFCNKIIDCFNYYFFDGETRIAEVESLGKVIRGDKKNVTNKIKIIREIPLEEQLELLNFDRELCKTYFKIVKTIQKRVALLGGLWYRGAKAGSFSWVLYGGLAYRIRSFGGRAVLVQRRIEIELYDECYNENMTLNITSNNNINREMLEDTLIRVKSTGLRLFIEELIKIF